MILRAAALLALGLGLLALAGYLTLVGRAPWSSPEIRHLRALKERRAAPASYVPATLADFAALPHAWPLASYAPLEARGVSCEGWVQRMIYSTDRDTHLELVAIPSVPDGRDTTYVTAEITPAGRRDERRWTFEQLAAAFRPNGGGPTAWDSGPARVRISGWLLYDFQYDVTPAEDAIRHGVRVSGWEIHPVTRIERWDDALGRWADLAP